MDGNEEKKTNGNSWELSLVLLESAAFSIIDIFKLILLVFIEQNKSVKEFEWIRIV